jgi:hypothetical protein
MPKSSPYESAVSERLVVVASESAPLLLESEQKMALLLQYNRARRGWVFQECL